MSVDCYESFRQLSSSFGPGFTISAILHNMYNVSFFYFPFSTNSENETFTRIRRDPNGLKLPMSPSGMIL